MNYNDKCRKASKVTYEIDYSESKPITPWGYVGYSLLWSIPVLGLIFWLVACFSYKNMNRRNYARSYVCSFLFLMVVYALLFIVIIVLISLGMVDPSEFDQGIQTASNFF